MAGNWMDEMLRTADGRESVLSIYGERRHAGRDFGMLLRHILDMGLESRYSVHMDDMYLVDKRTGALLAFSSNPRSSTGFRGKVWWW